MNNIEKWAKRIIELNAQQAEIEEAIKNLRAKIGEVVDDGDTLVGDFKINKHTNRRFDDALAKKNLSPEKYDSIAVLKADSKKAAALLDEEELDKCKKTFGSVVKVGLREDY